MRITMTDFQTILMVSLILCKISITMLLDQLPKKSLYAKNAIGRWLFLTKLHWSQNMEQNSSHH